MNNNLFCPSSERSQALAGNDVPPNNLDAVAAFPVQLPELPEQFPDRFPENVAATSVPFALPFWPKLKTLFPEPKYVGPPFAKYITFAPYVTVEYQVS